MARKVKNIPEKLVDWDGVNLGLRRMGELDIEKEDLEGRMTLEINQIKERYKLLVDPVIQERCEIEADIKAFVEGRKDEFLKTRSKDLDFGTIAYRVATSIPTPRAVEKLAAVIRSVKALGMNCLRVKEELDKSALEELSDQDLAKIGLLRKVEDKLRIEPKIETIKAA